ncbi:thiopurine S-methyltransferase-like [Hydra vulgaris]|uniref:Thiopurine S-methyltransferase-like n=1 Tax=Hydra vulgaris TaxID=6087 RepID=A0ABM4DNR0_HYDVU
MVDKREELNKYWCIRWASSDNGWVFPGVNPFLKLYFPNLTEGKGVCNKRVLVPLCGKTTDLLWLCEQDLSVTGIEFCEVPIINFFKEKGLSYECYEKSCHKVYKCISKDIVIYQGDFFSMNSDILGGVFDYCCDISSLSAMIPNEQKLYVDKLISLLSFDCRLILNCFEYDVTLRNDKPPYAIFRDRLENMFGYKFIIKELCCNTEDTLPEGYTSRIGFNTRHIYYMIKKIN